MVAALRTRIGKMALAVAAVLVLAALAGGWWLRGAAHAAPAAVPSASSTPTAAPAGVSVPATASVLATGGYALDFTLPSYGKAGCMVCHGDPKLVRAKGSATVSYWIDEKAYAHSAHANVACTGCHVDYGYSAPHGKPAADWRAVAKQSCKNCHQAEFRDIMAGQHAILPTADGKPDPKASSKPLCGDCHGGHDIVVTKKSPAGAKVVHMQSEQMCGKTGCHADYWANYQDYYHGAGYKAGAADAPACWDCHGTHTMLKSTDRFAPTNAQNLGGRNSCGGCHSGASSAYASYVTLIHTSGSIRSGNPISKFISSVFGGQ
jgi:hypothetical protein